jgi:WD40 repeat protein
MLFALHLLIPPSGHPAKYLSILALYIIYTKSVRMLNSGVLAMAWCPSDSGLLLTCGKDNRTLCWDINTGEVRSSSMLESLLLAV